MSTTREPMSTPGATFWIAREGALLGYVHGVHGLGTAKNVMVQDVQQEVILTEKNVSLVLYNEYLFEVGQRRNPYRLITSCGIGENLVRDRGWRNPIAGFLFYFLNSDLTCYSNS
jgi:hypothetical protein